MPDQPSTRKAELVDSLYSQYQDCERWAVIVGISNYQHQAWNLQYADRDAEEFYQLLLTPNGGSFEAGHICKLTNEQATTSQITQALRSFLQKPARNDLVILYFACHGSPDPHRPENLYLLTHNTNPSDIAGTALPMREVKQAVIENLFAERVLILADTCHSGGISSGGYRNATDDSTPINQYLKELCRATKGVATFTSAEPRQVAQEGKRWGGGHGVFTYYILEGMRGAADKDKNGIITVGELFEYVREHVKRDTDDRQHPLISSDGFDRNLPIAIVAQVSHLKETFQKVLDVKQIDVSLTAPQIYSSTITGKSNNDIRISSGTRENSENQNQVVLTDTIFENYFVSDSGIDYQHLRDLLKAGRWREADRETLFVMCAASGRTKEGYLTSDNIQSIPYTDFQTINQLWEHHSQNRFGFRAQAKIYFGNGGKLSRKDHTQASTNFGCKVGWRENRKWKWYYREPRIIPFVEGLDLK